MEEEKMRLSKLLDLAKLVQSYVESYGLSYEEAIERAKKKLLPDRVAAHKSENSISK
ncbi:MAG: hypothetical protein J6D47_14420 [Peptostreptococcaceae bacterium]|nr:hypothetical protein [Peptostreptococcaceae bacterium]